MTRDRGDRPQPQPDHPPDDAVVEAVSRYIDDLTAGHEVDPLRVLVENPGIGHEVLERLEGFVDLASDEPSAVALGTLGDYTLSRQVGRGGMGLVYDACQASMDRRVALKILPAALAADPRASARFMREAQAAGQLAHPNVVHVHGLGIENCTPYYAMEFVEGDTLAQILATIDAADRGADTTFGKKDNPSYFETVAEAFAGVADGLQHAHSKGIIHRDIKPSNLVLDRGRDQGGSGHGRLRILDFGLARLEGQESLTLTSDFVGTPLYMSPEQAQRRKISVDHRTDIYSLGATMYEALCGRPPFRGRDHADTLSRIIEIDATEPRKLNPRVPRDLETIVLKCLRKDPGSRFGTAEALAQDLRRFVRGDPVEAQAERRGARFLRHAWRQRKRLAAIVTVSALLVSLLFSWELAHSRKLREDGARYDGLVHRASSLLARGRAARGFAPGSSHLERVPPWIISERDLERLSASGWNDPLVEAQELLAEARSILSTRPEAHFFLGRVEWTRGNRERALEHLRRAGGFIPARALGATLSRETDSPESFGLAWEDWITAKQARRRQDWAELLRALDRLVEREYGKGELFPGAAMEISLMRCLALLELDRPSEAVEEAAHARRRWPDLHEAAFFLGQAWLRLGETARADQVFQSCVTSSRSPDRERLWVVLVCLLEGLAEVALEWVDDLGDELLRDRLEVACGMDLGDIDEAVTGIHRILARHREDYATHEVLARLLLNVSTTRRNRTTERELERVSTRMIEIDPDNSRGWWLRANARTGMADRQTREAGRRDVKEAVRLAPGAADNHWLLAWSFFREGDLEQASASAETAVGLDSANAGAWNLLGLVAMARGRDDVAEDAFRSATDASPGHPDAWHNWGRLELRRGRPVEAERLLRRGGRYATPNHRIDLARSVRLQGRLEEALQILEAVRERSPHLPRALLELGEIHEERGQIEKATEMLGRALLERIGDRTYRRRVGDFLRRRSSALASSTLDPVVDAVVKRMEGLPAEKVSVYLPILALLRLHASGRADPALGLEQIRSAVASAEERHPGLEATLAAVLFQTGQRREGLDILEDALELFGPDPALERQLEGWLRARRDGPTAAGGVRPVGLPPPDD